jgi:hypothetical protein
MNYSYGNKIFNQLKENKLKSIRILLEEDENDKDTEKESEEKEDIFAALDDKEESEDESTETDSSEKSEDSDSEENEVPSEEENDAESLDLGQIEQNIETAEKLTKGIEKRKQNPTGSVDDEVENLFFSASVQDSVVENYYLNKSIKQFLFEEEGKEAQSVEKLAKAMTSMEDAIKSSSNTLDKVVKGVDINMNKFVAGAYELVKHFDNKFSKWEIVKKACINTLSAHSGKNAEKNVREFEKLFHETLYDKEKVVDDKYTLPASKTHIAAGAKSSS